MNENQKEKFIITVKSNTKDLYAFTKLVPTRKKKFKEAPSNPISEDKINDLAKLLHPNTQHLIINEIKDETKSTKTFKFIPDLDSNTKELAYFRAGQYLSLKVDVNGVYITRPYSISSSPLEALKGFYEITIKRDEQGFLTNYIWKNWKVGTKIMSSGPEGFFYHEPLRDTKNIVGIAGGSGITPFRSMARAIIEGTMDAKLTILYGSSEQDDIIFYDEFKDLESRYPEKIKVIHVLSCENPTLEGCEKGFITSDLIRKYSDIKNSTYFICGPQIMYQFLEKEIANLNLKPKQVRREAFGEIKDLSKLEGFPKDLMEKTFKIKVQIGNLVKEIPAVSTESVLVALERAKLAPPSKCRSGECGFCRSLLISGNIYVSPISDWRRAADKKYNFFHPCSSYPLSDLEIVVPRNPK
ncbi:MAG: FAD-binding oxidoreductase [Promethearchaeota archaeon]